MTNTNTEAEVDITAYMEDAFCVAPTQGGDADGRRYSTLDAASYAVGCAAAVYLVADLPTRVDGTPYIPAGGGTISRAIDYPLESTVARDPS